MLETPRFPLDYFAQRPVVALPPWGPGPPRAPTAGAVVPWGDRGSGCEGSTRSDWCFPGPAGADYGQISEETWAYLHSLYGGGPEIAIRQSVAQLPDPDSLHGEQKIEAETRAL